jgi:hypothetical protein
MSLNSSTLTVIILLMIFHMCFLIIFSSLFDICVSLCSYAVSWPYGSCASALIRKN